ncbi:MAG: COX15/CtaA family protein [Rubrivivax sp.]
MRDATAPQDRRLPLLRRLAWLCTVLMLATLSLSAFLRLSQAGLGCDDWPGCYGQTLRIALAGDPVPAGNAVAAARLAHRGVASLTLLLVIVMTMATLARKPILKRSGALSLALLLLALGLAALGIATPGARLPAVAMGNLLGGFVMLALCWRLVRSVQPGAPGEGLGGWAIAGLLLLCAQLAGGALVSASHAGLSCSGLVDCTRSASAAGWNWQALNPWRVPAFQDAVLPINAGGAIALWAHHAGNFIVLPVLALLGVGAWRRGRRRAGAALLVLAALQLALGMLIVATGLPMALVLLHNLLAALLLATLVRLI